MSVHLKLSEEGDCMCEVNTCCGGPAFNSPEGKEKRYKGSRQLGILSLVQLPLSIFSIVIGLASIGVALTNPSYPQINGYAVLTGILVLIGAVYGRRAANYNDVEGADRRIRAYILVHYVMNIMCLTFAGLQIIFTGTAVGQCYSGKQEESDKCKPYTTANAVLGILVMIVGFFLLVTCIFGSVFFCVYARVYGFTNHYTEMRREIDSLRQQVEDQGENNPDSRGFKTGYSSFSYKSP